MNKGLRQALLTLGTVTLLSTSAYALPQTIEKKISNGINGYDNSIKLSIEGFNVSEVVDFIKEQPYYSLDSVMFGGSGKDLIIYPKYYETKESMTELSRIVSLVSSEVEGYTSKEKVYFIVQRIAELMKYDSSVDTSNSQSNSTLVFSPTTVLKDGKGVCQAYARLAHLMFKESGIESSYVEGKLVNVPHLWNVVKINGEWFSVDVTAADQDETGKIDFKYVFMKKDDLEDYGYKVLKTNVTLSNREIRDFKDIGLVSILTKNFYNQILEEVNTILAYSYKEKKLSVVSAADDFWVVGGELFVKKNSELKNMINNLIYYSGISNTDIVTNRDAELRVNDKLIYNSSNLGGDKVKVIDGDFKVVLKDSKLGNIFSIIEKANKTNIFYKNKFLIQYIRR